MNHISTKKFLEAKLKELNERAAEIEEKLSDPGESDSAENAQEKEGDEVRFEIGQLTKQEIREVEAALHRIESGKYGSCSVCQNKIPKDRLDALPYTNTCINCA